jgi:hypothetical protein
MQVLSCNTILHRNSSVDIARVLQKARWKKETSVAPSAATAICRSHVCRIKFSNQHLRMHKVKGGNAAC